MCDYQAVDVFGVWAFGCNLCEVGKHLVWTSSHVHPTVKHDCFPSELHDDTAPTNVLPSSKRKNTNHFSLFRKLKVI